MFRYPSASVLPAAAAPVPTAAPVTTVPSYASPPVYAAPGVPTAAPVAMAAPAMYEDIKTVTPFGVQDTIVPMNPYAPAVMNPYMPAVATMAAPPVARVASSSLLPPVAMAAPTMYEDIRTVTPFGVQDTIVPMTAAAPAVYPAPVTTAAAPVTTLPSYTAPPVATVPSYTAPPIYPAPVATAAPVAMAAPTMYEDIKTITPFGVQDTIVPVNAVAPSVYAAPVTAAAPVTTVPSYTAPPIYPAPLPAPAPVAMAAPTMYEDIKTVTPFGVQDTIVPMNPYAPTMAMPPVTTLPSYTSPVAMAAPAPVAMAAPAMYEDIKTVTPFGVQDTIVPMNPYAPAVATMAAPPVARVASASLLPQVAPGVTMAAPGVTLM